MSTKSHGLFISSLNSFMRDEDSRKSLRSNIDPFWNTLAAERRSDPIELLISEVSRLFEDDVIELYRIVFASSVESVDTSRPGLHYVASLSDFHEEMIDALYQNAVLDNHNLMETDCYLLRVIVPVALIDVTATILAHAKYPHETEVTLLSDHSILDISVSAFYSEGALF